MTGVAYVVSQWGAPTQTFVRREAEAVAALGVEVTALSLRRPGPARSSVPVRHLRAHEVVFHGLAAVVTRPARSRGVLWTVVRSSRPRLLPPQLWAALVGLAWGHAGLLRDRRAHAHFGWVAATAAWAAATWAGTAHSVVLHAFELHTAGLHDRFTGVPLRAATPCFVVTERDRPTVAQRWQVDAQVLRMGVPEGWLEDDATVSRDPELVVAVGSLVEKKGHDVLLRAIAACSRPLRVEILGAGPLEGALRRLRDELGLTDRVELVGVVDESEVRRRLQRAGVSVLAAVEARSGDRDGIPVALMESMALGTPVVTTRVGGIPELVEGVGELVAPGDHAALAAALERLGDPVARARWAELGRARIRDEFTVERSARLVASGHGTLVG